MPAPDFTSTILEKIAEALTVFGIPLDSVFIERARAISSIELASGAIVIIRSGGNEPLPRQNFTYIDSLLRVNLDIVGSFVAEQHPSIFTRLWEVKAALMVDITQDTLFIMNTTEMETTPLEIDAEGGEFHQGVRIGYDILYRRLRTDSGAI